MNKDKLIDKLFNKNDIIKRFLSGEMSQNEFFYEAQQIKIMEEVLHGHD